MARAPPSQTQPMNFSSSTAHSALASANRRCQTFASPQRVSAQWLARPCSRSPAFFAAHATRSTARRHSRSTTSSAAYFARCSASGDLEFPHFSDSFCAFQLVFANSDIFTMIGKMKLANFNIGSGTCSAPPSKAIHKCRPLQRHLQHIVQPTVDFVRPHHLQYVLHAVKPNGLPAIIDFPAKWTFSTITMRSIIFTYLQHLLFRFFCPSIL